LDLWEFGFSQSTPPSAISTDELERRAPDAVSLPEVSIVNCEANFSNFEFFTMMAAQMNGGASRLTHDDDSDDEMLATTLVEAMQEDEGDYDDVGSISGIQVTGDDLQARLAAAATPLEFQAGLPAQLLQSLPLHSKLRWAGGFRVTNCECMGPMLGEVLRRSNGTVD
jgi:hypothetical protein